MARAGSIKALLALALIGALCACRKRSEHDPSSKEEVAKKLADLRVGEERDMGGGTFMTLHRAQAAEPIGDGWHRARSTNGGFSVELPVPFNDLVIRGKTTDEVEMRSYTVGAKTPGLLAWSATCVARRDGKLGPEGRGAVSTGIEALGTPTKAYQRTVALEDRTCVLIVEAQGTDPLPPEVDRNRFFQSFRSTGAPAW